MTMADASPSLVWDIHCGTGESPVWDERAKILYFCDIPAGRLHRFDPTTPDKSRTWQLPEVLGSLGLCKSGLILLCQKQKIMTFDTETEALVPLASIDEPDTNRLNDGKVGPDGCFWVGTINEGSDGLASGHLYRVTPDGRVETKIGGLKNSNGLAWSADGRTMYHSDTRGPWIDCWDFDTASGNITNRRRFADVSDAEGRPDGAALAMDGSYWSAGSGRGVINRFGTDGKLIEAIATPVPNPTMPCFADGRVFITSGLPKDEDMRREFLNAGGLFAMATSLQGVPVARFADAD
jgi:sugar lactone lactonase YvrE